jgi:hypothetical protein
MSSNQILAQIAGICIASLSFFMVGALVGNNTGKVQLCAEQFKGEMHDGKCMFVTRTEITK